MVSIQKQYVALYESKCHSANFQRCGNTFARITNDVLQVFTFEHQVKKHTCTVEFAILPLCKNIDYLDIGHYPLDVFIPSADATNEGWVYTPRSSEGVHACLANIIQIIDEELIPFFIRANSCAAALPELLRLEEMIEARRIAYLEALGRTNKARPLHERQLFSVEKYYMALKAKDYQYAQAFLHNQIKWYESKLIEFSKDDPPVQPKIVIRRFEDVLELRKKHLCMIEENNVEALDVMLLSAERDTLSSLLSKYPHLQNKVQA